MMIFFVWVSAMAEAFSSSRDPGDACNTFVHNSNVSLDIFEQLLNEPNVKGRSAGVPRFRTIGGTSWHGMSTGGR